jgi:hypothetical protein
VGEFVMSAIKSAASVSMRFSTVMAAPFGPV